MPIDYEKYQSKNKNERLKVISGEEALKEKRFMLSPDPELRERLKSYKKYFID